MKYGKILLVVLALLLSGCGWIPPWDYYYAESFIAVYTAGKLNASQYGDTNYLSLTFQGEEYRYDSCGKAKDVYEELCIKNNDTEYDDWAPKPEALNPGSRQRSAFWKDIVAIDVVSDNDFDSNHPAGTSWNDVVEYIALTYGDYVYGGYKPIDYNVCVRYMDRLHSIPEDGLRLINQLSLFIEDIPKSAVGIHNLTITLTADDGSVFVAECPMQLTSVEEID